MCVCARSDLVSGIHVDGIWLVVELNDCDLDTSSPTMCQSHVGHVTVTCKGKQHAVARSSAVVLITLLTSD